jgi:diguanylate cyclase (GGDEF)-like protein
MFRQRHAKSHRPSGEVASPFQAVFQSRYVWTWLLMPDGTVADVNDRALASIDAKRDEVAWEPVWRTPWFVDRAGAEGAWRTALDAASTAGSYLMSVDVEAVEGPVTLDLTLRRHGREGTPATLYVLEGVTREASSSASTQTTSVPVDRDPLTGLSNRLAFLADVERLLQERTELAVVLLDLDDFHRINEERGLAAGDDALRSLADTLRHERLEGDVVARVGSDEFAIAMPNATPELTRRRITSLLTRMSSRTQWDERQRPPSITMGTASGGFGTDPDVLLRDAQFALKRAKAHARGGWVDFDDDLNREARDRRALESELDRALANEEFEVYFQPLVDAKSHAVIGAEALMRWRHPERGMVSPGAFIPVAEESGRIVDMDAWLQRAALTHLREWNRVQPDLHLSLNLSARQLEDPQFVDRFADTLRSTKVAPGNVMAEVTETFAMAHPEAAAEILTSLADLGVSLAIDDFGTGYSNLGQLQHLPFQVVKIDRSFLEGVPENQRNFALVRTIVAMAQSLDLRIIAEGVETKTQADFLYWEGATWLQGFHFGRPMPAATFGQVALGGMLTGGSS